jgi:hypothetical protein
VSFKYTGNVEGSVSGHGPNGTVGGRLPDTGMRGSAMKAPMSGPNVLFWEEVKVMFAPCSGCFDGTVIGAARGQFL